MIGIQDTRVILLYFLFTQVLLREVPCQLRYRNCDCYVNERWHKPTDRRVKDKLPVGSVFAAKYSAGILYPFPDYYDDSDSCGYKYTRYGPYPPVGQRAFDIMTSRARHKRIPMFAEIPGIGMGQQPLSYSRNHDWLLPGAWQTINRPKQDRLCPASEPSLRKSRLTRAHHSKT